MIELLPNDIRLLIWRELHRSMVIVIHNELFNWLSWDDDYCLYRRNLHGPGYSSSTYNWRHLEGGGYLTRSIYGYKSSYNIIGHYTYYGKLPVNY